MRPSAKRDIIPATRHQKRLALPLKTEDVVRSYGLDLLRLLKFSSLTFVRPSINASEKIRKRERQRLMSWAGCDITIAEENDSALLVTNDVSALRNRDQSVLIPKGEKKFDRLNRRRVLIPLGQDDAGLRALTGCLDLVRAHTMTIVFYHTTWGKTGNPSTDAWDHMTEKSRTIALQAVAAAQSAGSAYELVLEIEAPGVPEGIIHAANKYQACLIAMAYSSRNIQGSKAESVAVATNIPLLVVGNHEHPEIFSAPQTHEKPTTHLVPPPASAPLLSPWLTIHRVMIVAIVLTLLKGIAKILLGLKLIHSNAITADGYHSLSDVLPDILVMCFAMIAKRRADRHYPLGRGNLNTLITLGTGVALTIVCCGVISHIGLAIYHALTHQRISNLDIGTRELPIALAVTLTSALISFGVGSYQIFAGKKMRERSVAVDGAEMRGDGLIELATAAGLFGAYLFNGPWIEHLIGAFVLYFVGGTAKEFLTDGIRGLTQKSLGEEIEDALTANIKTIHGLRTIRQLKTFAIGGTTAVVMLKIEVDPGVKGSVVHDAARAAVAAYFAASDTFNHHEIWIEETEHAPKHRVAVAVTAGTVAPDLTNAQELWLHDVEINGTSSTINWINLGELTISERIELLTEKKTFILVTLFTNESERLALMKKGIEPRVSRTLSPHTLFFE